MLTGRTKNINLVEEVKDLLPVKFRQNPFNGGKDEKFSANKRPWRPYLLTDWPKITNLV